MSKTLFNTDTFVSKNVTNNPNLTKLKVENLKSTTFTAINIINTELQAATSGLASISTSISGKANKFTASTPLTLSEGSTDTLTVNNTTSVTENSSALITSGAVFTGLAAKANTFTAASPLTLTEGSTDALTIDNTNSVTENSSALITSGAVFTGLAAKQNTINTGDGITFASDGTLALSGSRTGGWTVSGNLVSGGTDLKMWNDTRGGEGASNGRLLVHSNIGAEGSKATSLLRMNYNSDFEAGTRIDSITGIKTNPDSSYDLKVNGNTDIGGVLSIAGYSNVRTALDAAVSGTTYTAETNGGLAVSSNAFSLDLANTNSTFEIPQSVHIEKNGTPQLLVEPGGNTSNDGEIEIRGARTSSTNDSHARIVFSNYDHDITTVNTLGRIEGRVTNATTNVGGLIFSNYSDGSSRTGQLTLSSAGNFNMGNGDTFQDDYKLKVNGTINASNISTNSTTITIGNTNVDAAATSSNSYSFLQLETGTATLGAPAIELRYAANASSSGSLGMSMSGDATGGDTTFNTNVSVVGRMKADNYTATEENEITNTGDRETSLNLHNGVLLCESGTGAGMTANNGVLQIRSSNNGKLKDGAVFRPNDNGNNIINFLNNADNIRGRVDGTGSSSVRYRTSSDRRLKENVENVTSCWELVKDLNVKTFDWIEDGISDVGFIAQEVYALNGFNAMRPLEDKYYDCDKKNMIFEEDGYCEEPIMEDGSIYPHALDYGNFTPYLWKALQEAILKIETLENKVAVLEEQLA